MTEQPPATPIASIRQNASALESWMKSVERQVQEAQSYGGHYGHEHAARDALQCAFRIAVSVIAAFNDIAAALDALEGKQ